MFAHSLKSFQESNQEQTVEETTKSQEKQKNDRKESDRKQKKKVFIYSMERFQLELSIEKFSQSIGSMVFISYADSFSFSSFIADTLHLFKNTFKISLH